MYQLVILEKYSPSSIFWPNLKKDKRIPELSVEQLLSKYQGFEGEPVSFFDTIGDEKEFKEIIEKYSNFKKPGNFFVHVLSDQVKMPYFLEKQVTKVGYDVGVCDEGKTIYSSIFNEVLFGNLDELASYKDLLNENLLFPDRSIAEEYIKTHDELSAQGKDVEDYEEMVIYEVWKDNRKG